MLFVLLCFGAFLDVFPVFWHVCPDSASKSEASKARGGRRKEEQQQNKYMLLGAYKVRVLKGRRKEEGGRRKEEE